MTKEDENRVEIPKYWWNKSKESPYSARRELEAGAYEFAMNRIYYAAFYGVSAVLFEKKLAFKKHSGVRSAFHREIIKKGILDIKWGKFYD